MNLTLISAAIAAACGFGLSWQLQGHRILKIEMEAKDAIISQQRQSRAALERATLEVTKAQNDAQARRAGIAAVIDSNRDGLIGLRNTAATVRATAATTDASAAYADTVSQLFDSCSTELVRVAGQADLHINDLQTLREAWPR